MKEEDIGALMSLHVSLTGIRGIIGPLCGYALVAAASIQFVSWFSIGLQAVALWMFIRLKRKEDAVNQGSPLHSLSGGGSSIATRFSAPQQDVK